MLAPLCRTEENENILKGSKEKRKKKKKEDIEEDTHCQKTIAKVKIKRQ